MYTNLSRNNNISGNISEKLIEINFVMEHRAMLADLLKKFTQAELSDLLEVTERSIQNYISETSPTNPHPKTVRKIREVYDQHILGIESPVKEDPGPYRTKRINQKNDDSKYFTVPLVPVKAQAGYVRAMDQHTPMYFQHNSWEMNPMLFLFIKLQGMPPITLFLLRHHKLFRLKMFQH
jgi:transcriptional regulator with XRE-family HTH domain